MAELHRPSKSFPAFQCIEWMYAVQFFFKEVLLYSEAIEIPKKFISRKRLALIIIVIIIVIVYSFTKKA